MYEYRRLSRQAQTQLREERQQAGLPLHNLTHRVNESNLYLLTEACFEHQSILDSDARRDEFAEKLLSRFHAIANNELFAWCLLPNHYHLLGRVDLNAFASMIARLYNGTSTQWNREDGITGRKV